MNIFNRVVVVLGILITMIIVTLALAFPVPALSATLETATALLRLISRIRPEYVALFHAVLILAAIFLDFMLLLLLISELRGPRRKYIRVQNVAGGHVSLTIDSIASRLRYHIDPLPDVLAVRPQVSRKRDSVALSLDVETTGDVNVPRKAEEVLEVARQVIEEKMGLKLAGQPQVMIRTVTPPGGAAPMVRPTAATASLPRPEPVLPARPPEGAGPG